MKFARALRWFAIAIAVAAVIDPAIASRRRADAVVAVLNGEGTQDSTLAAEVVRALDDRFTVIRAPFPAASATVLAGKSLPQGARASGGPTLALLPDSTAPAIAITGVTVSARIPLHARASIDVDVHAMGSDSVDVSLLDGDAVLDRASVRAAPGVHERVTLSFVPTRAGSAQLRVRAALRGTALTAYVDAATDVRTSPWSVLFFDARPSWMSTFVRRSLEQDPRFAVTSRTVTSRELATEFGRPPRALADSAALAGYSTVVVGAPDALSMAEVASLEHYMRTRGGAVLLLLDRRAIGAWGTLAQVRSWQFATGEAQPLAATIEGLRAGDVAWPAPSPPLTRTIATHGPARAPVVWRMPVGGGTLVVSGALDSWRYRDPAIARFDAFWSTLIGGLAGAAPPALEVTVSPAVVRPGKWVDVTLTSRDAALVAPAEERAVRLIGHVSLDSVPVLLWPAATPGQLHGRVRAPAAAGEYTVDASAGDARSSAPLLVSGDVRPAIVDDRDLMRAWAASRDGAALDASGLNVLADSIDARLGGTLRREQWHPMRSGWWILPFVFSLGGEWLIRRRRGLL